MITYLTGTKTHLAKGSARLAGVLAALCVANPAAAQFFARCDSGGRFDLEYSIRAYEEHSYRLNQKFLDVYYPQDELPESFSATTLEEIQAYLRDLRPRRAALVFYAYSDSAICSWLISADDVVSERTLRGAHSLEDLGAFLRHAIGVSAIERSRSPRRRGVEVSDAEHTDGPDEKEVLAELRRQLLPNQVRSAVLQENYDTLLIAPVTNIATLPLAALPVDDSRSLADVASILVLPGLFSLRGSNSSRRVASGPALVVGDPIAFDDEWDFPPLPGAREEAIAVANQLKSEPLLGGEATLDAVLERIAAQPLTLIYLATHGVASRTDPRDASFLLLTNDRWAAADIQNLSLPAHPLVVLSACQTGLGKDFDVGTIGMARAWERAGASNIAISLWNVGDLATRDLMVEFVARIDSMPVDKALQEAMLVMRGRHPGIAHWASFTIFGLPESLALAQPASRRVPQANGTVQLSGHQCEPPIGRETTTCFTEPLKFLLS